MKEPPGTACAPAAGTNMYGTIEKPGRNINREIYTVADERVNEKISSVERLKLVSVQGHAHRSWKKKTPSENHNTKRKPPKLEEKIWCRVQDAVDRARGLAIASRPRPIARM